MRAALLLPRSATKPLPAVVRCQRRWARVHNVRFFAAHPPAANIHDRYKEKLEQKARQHGLKDTQALKEAYSDKIQQLRKQAIVPGANTTHEFQPPQQTSSSSASPLPTPSKAARSIPFQPPPPPQPQSSTLPPAQSSSNGAPIKTLSSFIDVEKTSALPAKEIEAIWRLRHIKDAHSLCAVLPTSTFARIAATARKHPQFILPIPREGQGAEIHFLQWTFPSDTTATVLFTHLAEFKLRGEYAQPHTTVTHHLDLAANNGLVLLEGRVQEDRGVSVDEGKWLLMCLQKFYGFEAQSSQGPAETNANTRRRLMEQFSGGDENFKIEELLEEAEKIP